MSKPPQRSRTGRPGFLCYGSGIVSFGTSLENQLVTKGGSLEAIVVHENYEDLSSPLVHLLVYKDAHGRYFDVVQPSTVEHKIYKNSGYLIQYIGTVREVYPQLPPFSVPELNASNVVLPGGLR